MYLKPTSWAHVDEQGRLNLPPEETARFGLKPGASVRIEADGNLLRLHRPYTHLAKIYVEPTNLCNLACRICVRNIWDEPPGRMTRETFDRILEGLPALSPPPTLFFGGLGEPLSHPRIFEMIAGAKSCVERVELITNATLLDEACARELVKTNLDMLWVSLDGATPESYADIRLGAALPEVLENLARLKLMRTGGHHPRPEIGIVFVAMQRNITELPAVIRIGRKLGARRFFVTHVFPYTADMQAEMLYSRTLRDITYIPSPWLPELNLPKMQLNDRTRAPLSQAFNSGCNITFSGNNLGSSNDVCTFIASGSMTIGWDGSASPCLPLLHNYSSYLHQREHVTRRYIVGNIAERSLSDLWLDPEYVSYRQRVQEFAFAPCTVCGGCDLSEANEEDCFGNSFPACGSCLWAQGLIQCP